MAVIIGTQPVDSRQAIEYAHEFVVRAVGTDGPLRYQWYVGGEPVEGATGAVFRPLATAANTGKNVKVFLRDNTSVEISDIVKMWTTESNVITDPNAPPSNPTGYETVDKHALLWNFKNDTFTWKDPFTEQLNDEGKYVSHDVSDQVYAFLPGFQQRWEDYKEGAILESTWTAAAELPWFKTFSKGSDKEMLVVSNGQLFKAEAQRNRAGSFKKYYVERTQLDFDGVSPEFRSGKVKQTKRFVMDVQGDQKMVARGTTNKVDMYVGWSMNLMDDPNYKKANTFNLQASDFGGSYKVDYRSSGRYMGLYFDMTEASQLSFTGGEIDLSQTSGR